MIGAHLLANIIPPQSHSQAGLEYAPFIKFQNDPKRIPNPKPDPTSSRIL
jgi:hypothetical protein